MIKMDMNAFYIPGIESKVCIVWDIPHSLINRYTIYRDDVPIVTGNINDEDFPFEHPTPFDRDHHTNLFFKDSPHQYMYIDRNIYKHQYYKYQVYAERVENGEVLMRYKSKADFIGVF